MKIPTVKSSATPAALLVMTTMLHCVLHYEWYVWISVHAEINKLNQTILYIFVITVFIFTCTYCHFSSTVSRSCGVKISVGWPYDLAHMTYTSCFDVFHLSIILYSGVHCLLLFVKKYFKSKHFSTATCCLPAGAYQCAVTYCLLRSSTPDVDEYYTFLSSNW